MGFYLLVRVWLSNLPKYFQTQRWILTLGMLYTCSVFIEHTEDSYEIISQRMEIHSPVVTPAEIDIMEKLCIVDLSLIDKILYDLDTICSPGVKEFFYERMDGDAY